MFTVIFEYVPIHFWEVKEYNSDKNSYRYWAETGYTSEVFSSFNEAFSAAKEEITNLNKEFGCFVYENNDHITYWWEPPIEQEPILNEEDDDFPF